MEPSGKDLACVKQPVCAEVLSPGKNSAETGSVAVYIK